MPLTNLADHLKTTPTQAPPSLGAVRSQLRFWGMGNASSSGASLPDLQSRMGKYSLDATTHLAQLQRRASEMQIGAETAVQAVEAGKAEDASTIQSRQLDFQESQQEEDILGLASRATAGLIGMGKAARVVSSAVGLEGVQKFLEKMPLIGKSKNVRQAEKLQNEILEAYEQKDVNEIARLSEELEWKMDFIVEAGNLKKKFAETMDPEYVEMLLGSTQLTKEYEQINQRLNNLLRETYPEQYKLGEGLSTLGRMQ